MIDYLYFHDYDPKSVNDFSTINTKDVRGDIPDDSAALEHQSEGSGWSSLTAEGIDGKSADEVVTISELPGDGQRSGGVAEIHRKQENQKRQKEKGNGECRIPVHHCFGTRLTNHENFTEH